MNRLLFENDYSADSLRWIETYKSLQDHKVIYSGDKRLDKIQGDIISNKDAALAYFFSCDMNYKTYRMQDVILKSKEPKYALLFAQNIPNADIQALQTLVIDSGKIGYICKFACFVPGADRKRIESILLKQNKSKAKWLHTYIKHIPNANIEKFKKAIIESRKPRYLFELAKHLKSRRDISKIEDIMIELRSWTYVRLMAREIEKANIKKLENAILESGNIKELKKFAKSIRSSKVRGLSVLF